MNQWLLHLYDVLQTHRRWLWIVFGCVLIPLLVLALTLRYNEDIMDFLPIADEDRESMEIYQQQQSANRLVLIIEGDDPDLICDAIDSCADIIPGLITEVDIESYLARLRYVHSQMPYFLTETDYARMDSLFSPEAMHAALDRDRRILSAPGTGFLSLAIQTDPLGLLPLTIGARGQFSGAEAQTAFTSYDGYMMTADQQMGFCFYDTPYGGTETQHNATLVDSLQSAITQLQSHFPSLQMRWLGAPVVAVGNARRIKIDTAMCIGLSLVLIIALLLYAFPRKRDILLILLSISFGWLFGMAVLRLYTPTISAIVLGIGSVLIGIAVNYPLHLLVHQRYTTSVRQTLSEVLTPLVVGNITTVGAFLTLVPLHAEALRDLGIFAASMLVGTILFCVLVLPHLMSAQPTPLREIHIPAVQTKHSTFHITAIVMLLLTIAAGSYLILCPQERFDSNLSHINYMTPQQRADFAYFDSISSQSSTVERPTYLAPTAREELAHRAELWQNYWQTHSADSVAMHLRHEAEQAGFRPDVFEPFYTMLTDWQPMVDIDTETLGELWPGQFDSATLNAHLTKQLSDHFDYIGLCCSLIVFLFLWLSFRNLWLALIAFVPMALSWVWILAIMQLLGLQFNIVNIILATFIFGQGDDYTIFVVEGLLYEHRTGRPILPQYRQSIFLSALIMLVGIGILVLAVHPAMHMLGAVTLIGMCTVVLMALTIPNLLFRLLVRWCPRWIQ